MAKDNIECIGEIDEKYSFFEESSSSRVVVLTDERKQHIRIGHAADLPLLYQYGRLMLQDPLYILHDTKRPRTIKMIGGFPELDFVLELVLCIALKVTSSIRIIRS